MFLRMAFAVRRWVRRCLSPPHPPRQGFSSVKGSAHETAWDRSLVSARYVPVTRPLVNRRTYRRSRSDHGWVTSAAAPLIAVGRVQHQFAFIGHGLIVATRF
ncbi:excisionase [Streptomyces sp. x-80]|uniref:excisionase n=1 Tax=Streptomyces sp. x-80 TaxID=2789282 RepID=UPI00398192A0